MEFFPLFMVSIQKFYSIIIEFSVILNEMKWLLFFLFVFVLDSEPTEEVLETGNGHGGGKR